MPSLLQLQSEPAWNAEIVTPEAEAFGEELCRRTGRPLSAFGCKGNEVHLSGGHRSQRWIQTSRFCVNRTYTIQAGLTQDQLNHCAAIDFTPGTAQEMIAQSRRIRSAMIAGQLDEVVEFFGNINGDQIVDGWDNIDDEVIQADSSHLWHWHVTINRRLMRSQAFFTKFLNIVLGVAMTSPLTPQQDAALAETWTANVALRSGGAVAKGGRFDGGPHWTVTQVKDMQKKLDSLLTQVGELTVAVTNLDHKVDAIIAQPMMTIEPVALAGELRFERPTP